MRDSQKQKVYDAEWVIRGRKLPAGEASSVTLRNYASVEETQEALDGILADAKEHPHPFVRQQAQIPVTAVHVAGGRTAWYRRGAHTITLPPWAQNDLTLVHEVTHHFTVAALPNHGAHFCARFLDGISRWVHEEVATALAEQYRARGVRYDSEGEGVRLVKYGRKLIGESRNATGEWPNVHVVTLGGRHLHGRLILAEVAGGLVLEEGWDGKVTIPRDDIGGLSQVGRYYRP